MENINTRPTKEKKLSHFQKIVSNFKKNYPDMSIATSPIKMGVYELLG